MPAIWSRLVEKLRRSALGSPGPDASDAQLLQAFVATGDELAFEALVRRYGPMVLGVCRRVVGHVHDAEDAFQATFLVLARRAASVRPPELVGHWLYGVAYRSALEARTARLRRASREKQVNTMPEPEPPAPELWDDLQPLLDQELMRLPEKYRLPIVLCELNGGSRKEVARRLGIPEGTLSSRLATARKMLADRLSRRGIPLSVGLLTTLLTEHAASAHVPTPLILSTVKAATLVAAGEAAAAGLISAQAAAIAQGVLHTMYLTKLKIAAVVAVTIGTIATGAGLMLHQALAADPDGSAIAAADDREQPQATKPKGDGDKPKPGPRDGDKPVSDTPKGDGDKPKAGPRDGDKPKAGPRDGDKPKPGPRDGDKPVSNTPKGDGDKPRDGDKPNDGTRGGNNPFAGVNDGEEPLTLTGTISATEVKRKTDAGDEVGETIYVLTDAQGRQIRLPSPRVAEDGRRLDPFNPADFVGKVVVVKGQGLRTVRGENRLGSIKSIELKK
ncbi:MAG: sigma-70 family RNA polymerase sigma factor [Gemmataceae bacterium]|nr:sigma-70 family RNA polymerase sigma factor [Gemmataceae bacterium]MDW8266275.1 sigma-70 family RNA polymerase sigma factor [Gemmataceae bacterium]